MGRDLVIDYDQAPHRSPSSRHMIVVPPAGLLCAAAAVAAAAVAVATATTVAVPSPPELPKSARHFRRHPGASAPPRRRNAELRKKCSLRRRHGGETPSCDDAAHLLCIKTYGALKQHKKHTQGKQSDQANVANNMQIQRVTNRSRASKLLLKIAVPGIVTLCQLLTTERSHLITR